MNHAVAPQRVRELIHQTLVAHGARTDSPEEESLLIRDGAYCGHRISVDGFRAVWFIEEDQVKFFDPDGHLLRTLCPSTKVATSKAA